MRRIICSVRPQMKKAVSAASNITALQDRLASIKEEIDNPDLSEDERQSLYEEMLTVEDELNFAWQDDEAEWDYARQRQEFNPDGSLKGYGDEIYSSEYADGNDVYVVKIWHECDPGHDVAVPEACEEIFQIVANSPDQAKEGAKMQWSGPIDRIEIIDINPEDSDIDTPFV